MANPIIQAMQSQQNPGNNIMAQAIGAMFRGESPRAFLQNLAKTEPRLQGLDLSNPDKAAKELCDKNGENYEAYKSSLREKISQFIAK